MTLFTTPPLADLQSQMRARLAARLGTDPTRANSNANVIADMAAGGLWSQYAYLSNMADQLFVETCDGIYLDRYAARYGIQRAAAAAAAGNAVFSGVNGIAIPSGTILLAGDGIARFATTSGGTIASGTLTLPILASAGGAAGNLAANAPLQLVVAIAGVGPSALLDGAGTAGGTDQEDDASLRARVLYRQANPPRGGAASDYYAWAREYPGVTRAWVFPLKRGAGSCDVTFVMDGRVSIIPLSGDVTAVRAAIAPKIPVTANRITSPPALDAFVFAPTADTKNIVITDLTPDTPATQAAVTAALQDLFRRVATPGGASLGDGVDDNNPAGSIFLSQIEQAVQSAEGVAHFTLTTPSSDITSSTGHIPVLGTITFA